MPECDGVPEWQSIAEAEAERAAEQEHNIWMTAAKLYCEAIPGHTTVLCRGPVTSGHTLRPDCPCHPLVMADDVIMGMSIRDLREKIRDHLRNH